MTTTLGISLTATAYARLPEYAQTFEQRGVADLWLSEGTNEDPFTILGALSQVTRQIGLATGIADYYTRHPITIARSIATLNATSNGRAILTLGTGVPFRLQQFYGISPQEPAQRAREYLHIIRKSLGSEGVLEEGVSYDGSLFHIPNCHIDVEGNHQSIPIFLAARLPLMLQVAGELASGALPITVTTAYLTDVMPEFLERGARRAGRRLQDLTLGCFLVGCIADSSEPAYQATRHFLATRAMNPATRHLFALCGFQKEITEVHEAMLMGERQRAAVLVTDQMVESLSFSGTLAEACDRIRGFVQTGIHKVILQIFEAPHALNLEQALTALLSESSQKQMGIFL